MKKFLISIALGSSLFLQAQKIDRKALVQRHNVRIAKVDALSSLSVGNGSFAFTVDVTGLQTFPDAYAKGVPLGTQSVWGWDSYPNVDSSKRSEALKVYDLNGRKVSFAVQPKEPERAKKAVEYFRVNPHRLQLGQLGFVLKKKDGQEATSEDLRDIQQELNLWTGIIKSRFTLEGDTVWVETMVDAKQDLLGCFVRSPLLQAGRIQFRVRIPEPNGQFKDVGNNFPEDQAAVTTFSSLEKSVNITCRRNTIRYDVTFSGSVGITAKSVGRDHYILQPEACSQLNFTTLFSRYAKYVYVPQANQVKAQSIDAWKKFWQSGGAVDFSGSTDPRAFEIERRVILSQYLTKIQCASNEPPQETGLTYNSWYGKPHLEMHWWHGVHFAQWGRHELLEKSLDWYFKVAPKAFEIAKRQGYEGLRWQKMTDPAGEETPSSVGAFLVWQQPHFIYMAEMLYRKNKDPKVLQKYKNLLFATADFMASYPSYDSATHQYNLGKGLIPAQECFDAVKTFNPTYELAYWSWALEQAQQWRLRSGLKRSASWDKVLQHLAPLPVKENVYLATESTPDCYTTERYLTDHPAVLGAYSTLPAVHGLDPAIMKNTLEKVLKIWKWNDTWGWDFPLTAMTAARLQLPEDAVNALLMPIKTNTYLVNGHNYQDDRLTIYLPGNGGVLSAVAMMCTGVDATGSMIGFPQNNAWKVRWEGLYKMF